MGRHKDPKFKKEDLIKMVVEWTGDGVPRARQIQYIKEHGYGIDYCYQIFKDAKPIVNEMLKDLGKERLESTIAELEQQRIEALDEGDRKLALEILKEINKISGLHKENLDVTTGGKPLENLTIIKMVEIKKQDDE